MQKNNLINVVLAGGGVKGIAYIGVFEIAEQKGFKISNIAGVSAGALAGSIVASGYNSFELKEILNKFDLGKIEVDSIPKKVPIISRYIEKENEYRSYDKRKVDDFINTQIFKTRSRSDFPNSAVSSYRGEFFKNLITLGKEGCLCDGDYLEEWISSVLAKKGIRYFGDLRGGFVDRNNPKGYKIRMTAVDANRGRIIILPDDIVYYDIDPDRLEVAKAVRMSTSVPFVFKPVELKKKEGASSKTYSIVDGGVLDNFPTWIYPNNSPIPTLGFKFKDEKNLISIDTPLYILKKLISSVHDIGVPKKVQSLKRVCVIDTSKVSSLDFNLKDEEKEYLYQVGKKSANWFFDQYNFREMRRYSILDIIRKRLSIDKN